MIDHVGGASNRRERRAPRHRPKPAFWVLAAFLILVFATGGSSRADAPLLFILRPFAIFAAAYGFATLPTSRWRAYRHLIALAFAILLLTLIHLVPVPPLVWRGLAGHGLPAEIDVILGSPDPWRPISLVPSATLNALFALSIPLASVVLAIQLGHTDRIRLLFVVLALAGTSALVGAFQAVGAPISLYNATAEPGVIYAPGLLANKNHQAALLATLFPMLAVAARLAPEIGLDRKLATAMAVSSALLIVPLLIVTGSRAGLALGLIAIVLTLFYNLLQVRWLDRFRPATAALIKGGTAVAITVSGAFLTIFAARDIAFTRLATAADDLRPKLWVSILPILPDYQPLGSGIGSYVEVYRSREPIELLRQTYSNHAHNDYLEVLMTAGIPGGALLIWAGVLVLVAIWRNRIGSEPATLLARLGVAIIIVLACASITDYPIRAPLLAALFAIAAMWCANPRSLSRREGA